MTYRGHEYVVQKIGTWYCATIHRGGEMVRVVPGPYRTPEAAAQAARLATNELVAFLEGGQCYDLGTESSTRRAG